MALSANEPLIRYAHSRQCLFLLSFKISFALSLLNMKSLLLGMLPAHWNNSLLDKFTSLPIFPETKVQSVGLRRLPCAQHVEARVMRQMALEEDRRADGRACCQVRPISSRAGLLPSTHGSALFTRGETQTISVVTLGALWTPQHCLLHAPLKSVSELLSTVKRYGARHLFVSTVIVHTEAAVCGGVQCRGQNIQFDNAPVEVWLQCLPMRAGKSGSLLRVGSCFDAKM